MAAERLPGMDEHNLHVTPGDATRETPNRDSANSHVKHEHPAYYQHPLPSGDLSDSRHDIAGFSVLHPSLSHLQFRTVTSFLRGQPLTHEVHAIDPRSGQRVGRLFYGASMPSYPAGAGEVGMVDTAPAYRGKGVAQALFDIGRQRPDTEGVVPQHSPERTSMGDAVARKVGGFVPPVDSEPGDTSWQAAHAYYRRTGKHALDEAGRYQHPR